MSDGIYDARTTEEGDFTAVTTFHDLFLLYAKGRTIDIHGVLSLELNKK